MQKKNSSRILSQHLRKHRQQKVWQILIPFLFMAAGIITLMVLVMVSQSTSGSLDQLTSISILWLVFPAIFVTFALLAFLIVLIVLLAKVTSRIPLAGLKISTVFYQVATRIHKAADSAAAPTIKFKETLAGVRALFHRN